MSIHDLMPAGSVNPNSAEFWHRLKEEPRAVAAEVCFVNMKDLDGTMQRHAALHAWIGTAFENARVEEEETKWELEKAQGRALLAAKKTKDPDTNRAKTAGVLKAEVVLDEAVQTAQRAVFAASRKFGALKSMERSLNGRKDLLIEIARRQRHEMGNYSTNPPGGR